MRDVPRTREQDRIYQREYRKRPDRQRQRAKERLPKQTIVKDAKNVPCADCGESYPSYVMDFDHVRGVKTFNIAWGVRNATTAALLAEIAKCDVVCSNCHRIRTHSE